MKLALDPPSPNSATLNADESFTDLEMPDLRVQEDGALDMRVLDEDLPGPSASPDPGQVPQGDHLGSDAIKQFMQNTSIEKALDLFVEYVSKVCFLSFLGSRNWNCLADGWNTPNRCGICLNARSK